MMASDVVLSFLCWSVSFYPQPIANYQRRSTHGLAIDFPALNVFGFAAYTVSTAAFLWSPTVREQYAQRHPVSPEPTVRFNDFVFAIHAAIVSVVVYSQFFPRIWGFSVGTWQKSSRVVIMIVICSTVAVAVGVVRVLVQNESSTWQWIDVVRKSHVRKAWLILRRCTCWVMSSCSARWSSIAHRRT
jgi:cystinosin